MFRKIADKIKYPDWAKLDTRYRRLDLLDRLLDGTFYEDLPFAFYDETEQGTGRYIPLAERRPSVQYGLPQLIAKTVGRKLFAGRHRPLFMNVSDKTSAIISEFLRQGHVYKKMLQAVNWGSVGSVVVSFSFVNNKLRLNIWRAKWCRPVFDDCECLDRLRIFYIVTGLFFMERGYMADSKGRSVSPTEKYWWVRDLTKVQETTYIPTLESDWNPIDGDPSFLKVREGDIVTHDFGFVPAEWMVNLSGGIFPDGSCTWDVVIPTSIEIDYTLSQLGRGVRYNASPEVVIQGELENYENGVDGTAIIRGPINMLKFKATVKDSEGVSVEGGDAKLLEMSGQGIKIGIEYVDKLRRYALETLTAIRKDPEQMAGPLSGRAMELIDEEFLDLVQELRTAYGDDGILALMKKILKAAQVKKVTEIPDDYEEMSLHWPRIYIPTPLEALQIAQAATLLTTPPTTKTAEGEQVAGAPMIAPEEVSDWVRIQLDMPMKPETEEKVELNEEEEEHPEAVGGLGLPLTPSVISQITAGDVEDDGVHIDA